MDNGIMKETNLDKKIAIYNCRPIYHESPPVLHQTNYNNRYENVCTSPKYHLDISILVILFLIFAC